MPLNVTTKSQIKMSTLHYPTDLTDENWQVIEKIIEPQIRKRKHSFTLYINTIFYIGKIGKQHIITETLGVVLAFIIHAANIYDSKGAFL